MNAELQVGSSRQPPSVEDLLASIERRLSVVETRLATLLVTGGMSTTLKKPPRFEWPKDNHGPWRRQFVAHYLDFKGVLTYRTPTSWSYLVTRKGRRVAGGLCKTRGGAASVAGKVLKAALTGT